MSIEESDLRMKTAKIIIEIDFNDDGTWEQRNVITDCQVVPVAAPYARPFQVVKTFTPDKLPVPDNKVQALSGLSIQAVVNKLNGVEDE